MGLKLNDKTRDIIKVVAPTLGAALGGPLGGLAGQILGGLVGGDTKDLEKVLLEQKPETMLALRKAEQDFLLKLEEIGVEKDRIEMADRTSARDMAKVNMKPQMVLSTVFIGGYFTVFLAVATGAIAPEPEQQRTIDILLGMLATGVPMILAFWFGSTSGSATKNELLYNSKPANAG